MGSDQLTQEHADFIVITEANKRIRQLERLNATLAAEIDRMRPVIEAAQRWARNDKGFLRIHLRTAVINYEAAKEQE